MFSRPQEKVPREEQIQKAEQPDPFTRDDGFQRQGGIRGGGLSAAAELEAKVVAVLKPDIDHYLRYKAQRREAYAADPELISGIPARHLAFFHARGK